jgi:NAD(P)-dependent dehydrogenase (short-subunit alcohol dehydrogenase family)
MMDLGLHGRTALVTGSSDGIGLAIARALNAEGARVAVTGRDEIKLDAAKAEVGAVAAIPCDLSSLDGVQELVRRAIETLGRVDILINCAGAARRVDPLNGDDDAFVEAMGLKYMGYVRASRLVAPHMAERGWGRILNIIGVGGVQPFDVHLAGGAANAALILFTKGFGRVMAPSGVLVNALNPGPVLTERARGHYAALAERQGVSVEEARREVLSGSPIGREATLTEIADVAAFIVSERASYLAATCIDVDGGLVAGT